MNASRDRTTTGRTADRDGSTPYRWPLSVFHLVGLAAGGVIGSGWIFSASLLNEKVGATAWLVWVVGGLLMFVVAWVMVELGREMPRTGGLIFLPLRSSGPLVATVVAAGLWIFYAINLASESISMMNSFVGRSILFQDVRSSLPSDGLTVQGWLTVVGFMTVISAMNLLLPSIFFRVNSWITVLKIGIIVATAALLLGAFFITPHPKGDVFAWSPSADEDWSSVLTSVVSGGVIYAYVGFQGPLDFAGDIRSSPGRRRADGAQQAVGGGPEAQRAREASRLSRAVLGTVAGSILLYVALQFAFARYAGDVSSSSLQPPFVQIAERENLDPLVWALRAGGVLAPMGAGLVFSYALTREVAALGRAHLVHRGLQTARSTTMGRNPGVYWLVLLVNLVLGVAVLALARGNWNILAGVSGVLALIVYAMPGVVLVAEADRFGDAEARTGEQAGPDRTGRTKPSPRRRAVRNVTARASFALISLVLYNTDWKVLQHSMATIGVGSAVLLGLPLVSRRWPGFARFYDAKAHALLFRDWRDDAAVRGVFVLVGHLVLVMLLARWNIPEHSTLVGVVRGALVVAVAMLAFELLVRASRRYTAPPGDLKEETPVTAGR